MTGNRYRYVRGAALAAVVALAAAGCNRPGGVPGGGGATATTRPAPPTTAAGGHGGMDHDHGPARLDHPPTDEQKKAALKWVDDTRAAVKAQNLTVAKLVSMHYVGIGDGVHYVKPEYTRDDKQLDPSAIEAFTVQNGKIVAAMYVMNPGSTLDTVPDIAGNWTQWHDHILPYRSADPMSDDFFRLGGSNWRHDLPMIHVWLQPNPCGPFAGAGVGHGSCIKELATY